MDIHRYNKRTGFIDKTVNLTAKNADSEFAKVVHNIKWDAFCEHYRVTLVCTMGNRIVKDSDYA